MECFLFLLPNYIHVYAIFMQQFPYLDKKGVLQREYSQPPLLLSSLLVGSKFMLPIPLGGPSKENR